MTTAANLSQKRVNGVDVTALGETLETIKNQPELGRFQFRAQNRWVGGSLNRSMIKNFYGAGQEHTHRSEAYAFEADEPPVLLGNDKAANPVEYLLHALAGCMTTTMVYHAAARGIAIEEMESSFEGDIDIRGFTGVSDEVPKGYQQIRVTFRPRTAADGETLATLAKMSPVYNSLCGSVPIEVTVEPR